MIIYEVTIDLDAGVRDAYCDWLAGHMREIAALPGFTGAELFECTDPAAGPGRCVLSVQYRLSRMDDLARYLREHAPRLRAEGEARFGGRFQASRRVLRRVDATATVLSG